MARRKTTTQTTADAPATPAETATLPTNGPFGIGQIDQDTPPGTIFEIADPTEDDPMVWRLEAVGPSSDGLVAELTNPYGSRVAMAVSIWNNELAREVEVRRDVDPAAADIAETVEAVEAGNLADGIPVPTPRRTNGPFGKRRKAAAAPSPPDNAAGLTNGPFGMTGAVARAVPPAPLVRMKVADIAVADGANPRKRFDAEPLAELAASMRALGQLQPLACRERPDGSAELVFGERRLRALKLAGQTFADVLLYPRGTVSDAIAADMRLTENLRRQGLTHMEIAEAFGKLRVGGATIPEIAGRYHFSDDFVRRHLDLLRLCEPVRELVHSGRLPVKQAELITRTGDEKAQLSLASEAVGMHWRPRSKEWGGGSDQDYVQPVGEIRRNLQWQMKTLGNAGWPMDEPFAGRRACAGCRDNTATEPMLFDGVNLPGASKKGNCTNRSCFETKWKAFEPQREADKKVKAARARADGKPVCRDCGRIGKAADGENPEGWPSRTECGRCAGASTGGWDPKKDRPFPDTPAEHLAVALHAHGVKVREAIAGHVASLPADVPFPVEQFFPVFRVCSLACDWGSAFDMEPAALAKALAAGDDLRPTAGEVLDALDAADEAWRRGQCPRFDPWGDAPVNVPLSAESLAMLDCLRNLAGRLGLAVEAIPTAESVAVEAARSKARDAITTGTKARGLPVIEACADAELLRELQAAGLRGKWRTTAIDARLAALAAAETPATGNPREAAEPPATCTTRPTVPSG